MNKKKWIILISVLTIASILYATGNQIRDAFESVFRAKTKSYSFRLLDNENYPIPVDQTNDVVKFRVKRNTADTTFIIDKTCTFSKKFYHTGITGTLAKNDSVTGATSAATAKIGYVDSRKDYIYLYNVSGTFVSGEQVYKTINVNYVTLYDDGVWCAITTLSASDTTKDIGDCYAYVEISNSVNVEDEVLLKSKWKIVQ